MWTQTCTVHVAKHDTSGSREELFPCRLPPGYLKQCKHQGTNGPVSLTWVHRICWIWTSLEIHDYCCISFHPNIRKHRWPYKWPRSIHCHHLNKFGCTWVPDAVYQVLRSTASWFWRRIFFKVFTIYGPGSHLGHVARNIWTNFYPNSIWNLASNGLVVLGKKFENV